MMKVRILLCCLPKGTMSRLKSPQNRNVWFGLVVILCSDVYFNICDMSDVFGV